MHVYIIQILKGMWVFGCALLMIYIYRLVIGQCTEMVCWWNCQLWLLSSELKVLIGLVAV